MEEMRGAIEKMADIIQYVQGGRGVFTLENKNTGIHYTYKISCPRHQNPAKARPLWISVLTYEGNYTFIGTVWNDFQYKHSAKTKITEAAISVKGLKWLLIMMKLEKEMPEGMYFWHEGICCRCGRRLTVPESIANGIGPICIGLINLKKS